jgi:outer membrane PBP1 activator LpoA protein
MNLRKTNQRSFIRIIPVILLFMMIAGCAAKYPLISVNQVKKLKVNGYLPQKQYIIINKSLENLDSSSNDEILTVLQFINQKKLKEAENYIQSLSDSDQNTVQFCKGLLHFYQKQYAVAYYKLDKIEIEEYNYLRYLLVGDCMMEMNTSPVDKHFNKSEILLQFQKSMDTCHNEKIKEVIKIHIKYVQYGDK